MHSTDRSHTYNAHTSTPLALSHVPLLSSPLPPSPPLPPPPPCPASAHTPSSTTHQLLLLQLSNNHKSPCPIIMTYTHPFILPHPTHPTRLVSSFSETSPTPLRNEKELTNTAASLAAPFPKDSPLDHPRCCLPILVVFFGMRACVECCGQTHCHLPSTGVVWSDRTTVVYSLHLGTSSSFHSDNTSRAASVRPSGGEARLVCL